MQHDPAACTCPCHVQCVHRSEASSRAVSPDGPCDQVLLLIRFAEAKYQRYLNAITSVKSIMKVYGGKSFGVVDHIKHMGGTGWQDGYLVGLCVFGDMRGAQFWYRSDVFSNQHDWLDDTDIIAIPLRRPMKENTVDKRSVFLMGNFFINDEPCFQSEFMDKVVPLFKSGGAEVLADGKPERLHGNWNAGRFFLVQCPDEASFHQSYNKEEMISAEEACHKTSCGCTIMMQTDTNMPGTPSHRKPVYL